MSSQIQGNGSFSLPRVSNPLPMGCLQPRMAMSMAQHKIINLLKTLSDFFMVTCHNVIQPQSHNGPRQLFFFPVWPRDAKMLDTPGPYRLRLGLEFHSEQGGKSLVLSRGKTYYHLDYQRLVLLQSGE